MQLDADNPHLNQSLPTEYLTFDVDGQTLIARNVPEGTVELFEVVGATRNVRTLASADAVLLDGTVVEPFYQHEYRCVDFCHVFGGRIESRSVAEWLDDSAIRLRKLRPAGNEAIVQRVSP